MISPYDILEISQDADIITVNKAFPLALRKKKFTPREIAEARKQLCNPESRLSVDFLFPVFSSFNELVVIDAQKKSNGLTIENIYIEKYDTLKNK